MSTHLNGNPETLHNALSLSALCVELRLTITGLSRLEETRLLCSVMH